MANDQSRERREAWAPPVTGGNLRWRGGAWVRAAPPRSLIILPEEAATGRERTAATQPAMHRLAPLERLLAASRRAVPWLGGVKVRAGIRKIRLAPRGGARAGL